MRARLLVKAAVLLAVWVGSTAIANEPGMDQEPKSKTVGDRRASLTTEEPLLPDATLPANAFKGRSPRVVIIIDPESTVCRQQMDRLRKPGGEFAAMQSQGWKIGQGDDNHVQLVDRRDAPELIEQLKGSEFPVVACLDQGEIVRSFKDGCSTPLDAWTFGWLLKGVNERPRAPIPEAIRVATTGHYPLRGNHWSVDGENNPSRDLLVSHLKTATHVNYLNADWKLEEWSVEELRSLHDDLHEKYGPAAPVSSSAARPTGLDQFSGNRKALGK